MASMELELITGVWGQSTQQGPEGQLSEAPLKLKAFWSIFVQKRGQR